SPMYSPRGPTPSPSMRRHSFNIPEDRPLGPRSSPPAGPGSSPVRFGVGFLQDIGVDASAAGVGRKRVRGVSSSPVLNGSWSGSGVASSSSASSSGGGGGTTPVRRPAKRRGSGLGIVVGVESERSSSVVEGGRSSPLTGSDVTRIESSPFESEGSGRPGGPGGGGGAAAWSSSPVEGDVEMEGTSEVAGDLLL
ncbi:hypothetical protein HK104_008109, partial [Borealophlyctis nickersoniae]